MPRRITVFFVILMTSVSVSAQEKEWKTLTGLLQQEAEYFSGKSGFIQLGKSEYNTFIFEKISVNDTLVNFQMKMQDRFGNEDTERHLEETIVLEPEMKINSAITEYNYRFYFEDFPQSQFLLLEFEKTFPMINQIVSVYKALSTGQEDRSVLEETTYRIYFPIRSKSREKIFKAINKYQLQTLKKELENDSNH